MSKILKKMTRIDVISSCLVGMAGAGNGNATSMSELQLSALDLLLLLVDPIQRGLLFHKPPHQSPQTLIHHLKTSLSRTLDFFPPLAGRLATTAGNGSFFVYCNNTGAEFVHAAAAIAISDIIEPKYVPEFVSSLFPLTGIRNFEGVSKPLLAVQVTELVDGVFIACTANHAVIDGISFWHFLNSWSEISRGMNRISKYPVFQRSFPAAGGLPPLDIRRRRAPPPPPPLERIFHFSKESIAKLKAKANAEAGTDKISSLQALSAHLWRCYLRCRRDLGGGDASFSMTVRARIPLPEGYFGNTAYGVRAAIDEGEVLQKGLGYAALKINEFVAAQTKEEAEKLVEERMRNPLVSTGEVSCGFFIISSPRHNVYGNDFGWGKPIAARGGAAQKYDGWVSVLPAAEAGGIDADVCFAPEVLHAMEADAEFMEALSI